MNSRSAEDSDAPTSASNAAAHAASAPVLSVRDLHVRFRTSAGGRKVVHAVTGVSLDISAGETLGLIGESGSGKSTVARAVSQLLRAERAAVSGEISLGSTRLDNLSNRRLREQRSRMQMIFQDPNDALDPRMTVR
ncbi:MAG: ABC-type glutathione transport system ATPase component, partial [Acidimicrobiales bacterium]